jgi:hypothetical protein
MPLLVWQGDGRAMAQITLIQLTKSRATRVLCIVKGTGISIDLCFDVIFEKLWHHLFTNRTGSPTSARTDISLSSALLSDNTAALVLCHPGAHYDQIQT